MLYFVVIIYGFFSFNEIGGCQFRVFTYVFTCVTTKEGIERPAVLSSQNSARGTMKFGGISGINDTKL